MSISKYFAPISPDTRSGKSTPAQASPRQVKRLGKTSSQHGTGNEVTALQDEWRVLYTETLPSAARSKAPSQLKWPVTLDHCFGRIILDCAIGRDRPWMEVVKSPAIKHMNEEQLRAAIDLGSKILNGAASLVELDERSLALRGKNSKIAVSSNSSKKRTQTPQDERSRPTKRTRADVDLTKQEDDADMTTQKDEDRSELEAMIDGSDKTAFQKTCLKALLQIPAGQFSTYGALAKYLNSAPRAVGNAMRGNPFAPRVPCHRILAADRSIGGFGGSWGLEGKHVNEKLELLKAEGVKFDSKGKVLGPIFSGYR